ncbi:Transcriptional regulatory protein sin3 [Ceratobasidium sp. 428]|nr:Transcriptional regulatory protein sin3 [Ceratobasidium sp. 428]
MSSKVVVSRHLGDQAINRLIQCSDLDLVIWPHDRKVDREWLLENVKDAVGVVVTLTDKVDRELVAAAGSTLKIVSTMSVGYDHVDVSELKSKGIKLGFTPDVLTDAVADVAVMLALMASRNVKQSMDIVQTGKWPSTPWSPFLLTGPQLSTPGTTVGFIGFGRIAQATLARLIPFSISRVLYTRSFLPNLSTPAQDKKILEKYPSLKEAKHVTIQDLAKESDFIFVLAPGGEKTYHLVNSEFLGWMKPEAILVNPGRGSVVDSDALAEALREGKIWGAGLDVVDGEPNVPADHPLVKEPRAVVLPHVGSATVQTRLAMASLAAENLIAGIKGEDMPSEAKL